MRKNDFRTELIVGIFGIIALALIVYMSREVSDAPFGSKDGIVYYVKFDSVSGLIPKTPVEIAGIQVGFIESIDLDQQQAKLTLRLDPEVPIYEDAYATISSRGILGDKLVSVNPGSFGRPQLPPGSEFKSLGSSGDLSAVFSSMQRTSDNINKLADTLNSFIQDQYQSGNLDAIVDNLAEMTDRLNAFVGTNTDTMETLLVNLRDVSASLKTFVDSSVNNNLANASESLQKTLAALERIVGEVEEGKGTVGKLLKDETTISKLNNAIDGIENVTGTINRIRTDVRYRGEYLFDSSELQNLISLSIKPRPDKFFRFEIVDSPEGNTSITDTLVRSPNGTVLSTTETVETSDRVLFSFEMAKTFYDATFRFGIIRNEGGIGLDYSFYEGMFTLTAEAFNFGRFENNPHVRTYATMQVFQYLMLTAGFDDLLDKGKNIDPFVGAGISFRDDDIKSLFGLIAVSNIGN